MPAFTNNELLKGILGQNQAVLNYLYREIFPRVKKVMLRSGLDYDTANEIFQEAIIILYKKGKAGEIAENTLVESYLFGMCKIIMQNLLRENARKRGVEVEVDVIEIVDDPRVIMGEYLEGQKRRLFQNHFNKLHQECQKVLMAFFSGKSFAEIARELNFSSEEYARRRKYLCKEYLVKSIKTDPNYNEIINSYGEEPFEIY